MNSLIAMETHNYADNDQLKQQAERLKQQVLTLLPNWPELREKRFLLLDGDCGVGKTLFIGPALEEFTGLKHIQVDRHDEDGLCFLLGNGRPIPDQVKYDDLSIAISEAQDRCILDSAFALEIQQRLSERIGTKHDYHIFVELQGGPEGGLTQQLLAYRPNALSRCDRLLISAKSDGQIAFITEQSR